MKSALVVADSEPVAEAIAADLRAVGFEPGATTDCTDLLQTVIQSAPDFIICSSPSPDAALFDSFLSIGNVAPRPIAVFTSDPDAEKIGLATRSFVHAYVVDGYSRTRLRSVVHLAKARFEQERVVRQELADVNRRFDERKLVDRAKGILMGARSLREEEAYRALRTAAMESKQRIGQVSQRVIESARYAEAVNRAGQLRMLSQRLVKLYALACAGVTVRETAGLFADSLAQTDAILAILGRSLSQPTFGDLLAAVATPWARLHPVLRAGPTLARLREVDQLAEELLDHAERLTANLEVAAFATALHAINVAGRQRMLSQRLAKEAVMAALLPGSAPPGGKTEAELEEGLAYLRRLPLSNAEITREIEQTSQVWQAFRTALGQRDCERIALLSEQLLGHFDRLTDQLERAIQVFVG